MMRTTMLSWIYREIVNNHNLPEYIMCTWKIVCGLAATATATVVRKSTTAFDATWLPGWIISNNSWKRVSKLFNTFTNTVCLHMSLTILPTLLCWETKHCNTTKFESIEKPNKWYQIGTEINQTIIEMLHINRLIFVCFCPISDQFLRHGGTQADDGRPILSADRRHYHAVHRSIQRRTFVSAATACHASKRIASIRRTWNRRWAKRAKRTKRTICSA